MTLPPFMCCVAGIGNCAEKKEEKLRRRRSDESSLKGSSEVEKGRVRGGQTDGQEDLGGESDSWQLLTLQHSWGATTG